MMNLIQRIVLDTNLNLLYANTRFIRNSIVKKSVQKMLWFYLTILVCFPPINRGLHTPSGLKTEKLQLNTCAY